MQPASIVLSWVLATSACAAPVSSTAPIAGVLPALLDDAARRSGARVSALSVVGVEAVTWSDASLGCPQPGLAYLQVLTPGHRVRIEAPGGATLDYHLGARGRWLHCPAGRAKPPLPGEANPRI